MKYCFLAALTALFLLLPASHSFAAETNDPAAELGAVVDRVNKKIDAHQAEEKDLADNFKEFDALLEKYKDQKTDAVAKILLMKAMVYVEVLELPEKSLPIFEKLKADFPDTKPGKQADQVIASIKKLLDIEKLKKTLVAGVQLPDFNEKDLADKPLSLANYKGKVVLVDFWATWCAPCLLELPNVQKVYDTYHSKGLEIIGVSLDDELDDLTDFLKKRKIPWVQHFEGKGWDNRLATQYGINKIPATFLLDREGKIIARDLRGEELEAAVAKALAAKP